MECLEYSPVLLLDGRLSACITDDPEFSSSCEWGFYACLEEDFNRTGTESEIVRFVHNEMFYVCPLTGQAPLVTRVGVVLGWLSALALTYYDVALVGLRCLMEFTS